MILSNLPPGVSPNDPQIAGYPEGEAPHACDAEGCEHEDAAWPYYDADSIRYFDPCPVCEAEQEWVDLVEDPYWPEDFHLDDFGD